MFIPLDQFLFIYLLTLFSYLLTGVPRETEKEKELADFDIFDDPESPFSTFNFQYSNEAFTRLHDLMEFNTLNNLEVSSVFTGCLLVYKIEFASTKQHQTLCSVAQILSYWSDSLSHLHVTWFHFVDSLSFIVKLPSFNVFNGEVLNFCVVTTQV